LKTYQILLLFISFFPSILNAEQKDAVVVLNKDAGIIITKQMNDRYLLFPGITGFVKAVIIKPYDDVKYFAHITMMQNRVLQDTIKWFNEDELVGLTRKIGNNDTLTKNTWQYLYDQDIKYTSELSYKYGRQPELKPLKQVDEPKPEQEKPRRIKREKLQRDDTCEICTEERWNVLAAGKVYKNYSILLHDDELLLEHGRKSELFNLQEVQKLTYTPKSHFKTGFFIGFPTLGVIGMVTGGYLAKLEIDKARYKDGQSGIGILLAGIVGLVAGSAIGGIGGGFLASAIYDQPPLVINIRNMDLPEKQKQIRLRLSLPALR